MNLKKLFYRLLKESNHGFEELAEWINFKRDIKTSAKVLSQKFNPNNETHFANLDDAQALLDMVDGWKDLAEFSAGKIGGVVVVLPEVVIGDAGLLDAWMKVDEKRGITCFEFRMAWEDGRIDTKEFAAIKKAMHEQIATNLAFLKLVEQVSE